MAVSVDDYLGVPGERVVVRETSVAGPAVFWQKLEQVAAWLLVKHVAVDDAVYPVTEASGSRPHGPIRFVGAIEQRQLEPVVEVLRALATGAIEVETPATVAALRELDKEIRVTAVVSPTCPFCPRVTASLLRFACGSPHVRATVLRADTGAAPDLVRSVPAVLVDDQIVATGSVGEYALLEKILAAGASHRS
jgi:alkyl hydroperoxide reductase subunit AhpF